MAPSRTKDSNSNAEASSSKTHSKPKRQHQKHVQEHDSNAAPGVQKIKAALRQTRRLLAKDKLAADVRVETERRLKTLEAELHQAEQARKERAFAVRYHKIKFFERQKVTRKLKQVKKTLDSAESDSEKKRLSAKLHELRVDLNYILHYPKTKKYISLFPPEVRHGDEASTSKAEAQKTNEEREEVRKWIREQMKEGDLPNEPEQELSSQNGAKKGRAQKWPQSGETSTNDSKSRSSKPAQVEQDDFFEDDGDSD